MKDYRDAMAIALELFKGRDNRLQLKKRIKIASAVNHSKDEYVFAFDAINDDIFTYGKAACADAEIPVTGAASLGEVGQEAKSVGNGVNQSGGNIHAAAFLADIEPDAVKIGFNSWSYKVGH